MRLSTYVISQGDTIELLAQVLLGSRQSASELIQTNKLRYPYISDDPIDQYTGSRGQTYLTSSYIDPMTVTINNLNRIIISAGDTIFFSGGSGFGVGIVGTISDPSLTFTAPVIGKYDKATKVSVFGDQSNVSTSVLRTGDVLLYSTGGNEDRTSQYAFGTDLKLDEDGFLVRESQNLAVISGERNLIQAIRMRLQTEINSLKSHLGYGNRMFEVLGESNASYFSSLAKHYAVECVEQDNRVQDAEIQDFLIDADRIILTLVITPVRSQDRIEHRVEIKI